MQFLITQEIILQCAANSRKAQRELYVLCYPFLYRVAKRYASNEDDVEEIITESFLKVNDKIATVTNTDTFFAWIKKIAVNTAINIYRSRKKYKEAMKTNSSFSYDVTDYAEGDSSLYIDQQMETDYIILYINQLPSMTKEVFNLYAIDGFSHKEIADLLHIKEELSRWHLYSARKQLTKNITQYNKQFQISNI